ncbi:class E sortase [Streptomyces beihaiensis]|uniref:class E sortase n=1 Tax=Streptomyces beihaiensis TaxID=2984495 RepID=UPI00389AEA2B
MHQLWWTNRQAKAEAGHKVQALERQWGRSGASRSGDGSGFGSGSGSGRGSGSGSGLGSGSSSGSSSGSVSSAGASGAPSSDASSRPSVAGRTAHAPAAAPRYDRAYAVIAIPRLGLRAPIAEGVSKAHVLNHGYVGHYPGTAQPGQAGNFALAGHRNTHGEPFRYINRLRRGDTVTVETKKAVYTYVVDKRLAQTSASDGDVIDPVPHSRVVPGAGYRTPGYYITLTTCTPEFTSRYRLVVWGKLSSMRPR